MVAVGLSILICCLAAFHRALSSSEIWSLVIFGACMAILLVAVFAIFKVYRLLAESFGLIDALKIGLMVLGVSGVSFGVMYAIPSELLPHLSWPICALGSMTLLVLSIGFRSLGRAVDLAISWRKKSENPGKRTMVIGAGAGGNLVLSESQTNLENHNKVVVFLDDDPKKIGKSVSGVPVKGPISMAKTFIAEYEIEEVIIAIEILDKKRLHEIVSLLSDCNVRVRRLPVLSEVGPINEKTILSIDVGDLLGRDPIRLDNSEIVGMLAGSTVMITGAGGSIGSELCRQIYATRPKRMVLFDIYENGLYAIQQELAITARKNTDNKTEIISLIGSTYNDVRVEQIIKEYRPDYIYHAAAYKHVPLMEESPVEAVRSNDVGTYNVAKLADKYGVKKMLLVSTDKAVRPTNAMGASKRFAEMIIQHFARVSKVTKYCAVRFGNVLNSNGSVIPLFTKQIESGGPVTVTDPKIIRYFMTIPEAVGLILQSSIYAEKGEIFILDMGKPVKVLDVAEKMIRQAGYIPYKEMPIVFTGLRPGEKLYEETLIDPENQIRTANDKIFIEKRQRDVPIEQDISFICDVFGVDATPNDVKEALKKIVDTYNPQMND